MLRALKWTVRSVLWVAVLCAVLPVVTWAATTGSISGTVMDPSGAAIPGAAVVVTNTATGIQTKTTADSKGEYAFPALPPGRYDLEVMVESFRTHKRSNLVINADTA